MGKPLRCTHCDGDTFSTRTVVLSTRGLAVMDLEWLGRSSDAHHCQRCGFVHWFSNQPARP
jgi:hypothetical protein